MLRSNDRGEDGNTQEQYPSDFLNKFIAELGTCDICCDNQIPFKGKTIAACTDQILSQTSIFSSPRSQNVSYFSLCPKSVSRTVAVRACRNVQCLSPSSIQYTNVNTGKQNSENTYMILREKERRILKIDQRKI